MHRQNSEANRQLGQWQGFQFMQQTFEQIVRVDSPLSPKPINQHIRKYSCEDCQQLPMLAPQRKLTEVTGTIVSTNQNPASATNRLLPYKSTAISNKPYPAIKILRTQPDHLDPNIMVYKYSIPKSSDKILNTIRQAVLDGPIAKELHTKQQITFNSRFESGNLAAAFKVCEGVYNLYLRVDTNTRGHLQWYYFSVKNKKALPTVQFTIYMFGKPLSLYQRGMKPYVLSRREYQSNPSKVSWRQEGTNVRYVPYEDQFCDKRKFTLTFSYEFKHENDEVYFAACPPYTYSQLLRSLNELCENDGGTGEKKQTVVKSEIVANTLSGLEVPLITISPQENTSSQSKCFHKKPITDYIIITGRSHPGETSGSWVLQGLMQSLKERMQIVGEASRIIFKIMPMLNPDGVYLGNYRSGILGQDYNRKFVSGKPEHFPEIKAIKAVVQEIKQTGGRVLMFLDLHGHSILRNSFIYGPDLRDEPNLLKCPQLDRLSDELSKKTHYFKIENCRFKNEKEKLETARMYFQNREKIFSLTLENSLGLYSKEGRVYAFTTSDWKEFGKSLGQTIFDLAVGPSALPASLLSKYTKPKEKEESSENIGAAGPSPDTTDKLMLKSNKILRSSPSPQKRSQARQFLLSRDKFYSCSSSHKRNQTESSMSSNVQPKFSLVNSNTHKPSLSASYTSKFGKTTNKMISKLCKSINKQSIQPRKDQHQPLLDIVEVKLTKAAIGKVQQEKGAGETDRSRESRVLGQYSGCLNNSSNVSSQTNNQSSSGLFTVSQQPRNSPCPEASEDRKPGMVQDSQSLNKARLADNPTNARFKRYPPKRVQTEGSNVDFNNSVTSTLDKNSPAATGEEPASPLLYGGEQDKNFDKISEQYEESINDEESSSDDLEPEETMQLMKEVDKIIQRVTSPELEPTNQNIKVSLTAQSLAMTSPEKQPEASKEQTAPVPQSKKTVEPQAVNGFKEIKFMLNRHGYQFASRDLQDPYNPYLSTASRQTNNNVAQRLPNQVRSGNSNMNTLSRFASDVQQLERRIRQFRSASRTTEQKQIFQKNILNKIRMEDYQLSRYVLRRRD